LLAAARLALPSLATFFNLFGRRLLDANVAAYHPRSRNDPLANDSHAPEPTTKLAYPVRGTLPSWLESIKAKRWTSFPIKASR
jgi:hypothetical protein